MTPRTGPSTKSAAEAACPASTLQKAALEVARLEKTPTTNSATNGGTTYARKLWR